MEASTKSVQATMDNVPRPQAKPITMGSHVPVVQNERPVGEGGGARDIMYFIGVSIQSNLCVVLSITFNLNY